MKRLNMSGGLCLKKCLNCTMTLPLVLFIGLLLTIETAQGIFTPGKQYVYEYEAISSSGVLVPSKAQSSWGFAGSLIVKAYDDEVLIQFEDLKTKVSNGAEELDMNESTVNVEGPVADLSKPFKVQYKNGQVENFSVEANEAVWATNIKRSVAGILQLDSKALDSQAAFHSTEVNHYGECIIEYIVAVESDNKRILRKSVDPRTCKGHSQRVWSNVPNMPCPNTDQNPILKSSERFYEVSIENNNKTQLLSINATGEIYVQPFQSLGEAHFMTTNQQMRLISEKDLGDKVQLNDFQIKTLQHDLPGDDLTQGRGVVDKAFIFKTISVLLDRLSQRLENPGLDTEINNLHNTTISVLLHYLGMLNRVDLQAAYNNISGTSYKEETVRNMFLEALPQVGTTESALFVLELIQSRTVSDMTAIQLLTHLPFHVRKPDVQLLLGLQPLLNLQNKIAPEVQHTGILTFGTLIYKTCLSYCPYEMLDDYVKLYLDKLTESKDYEKKMVWLEGLSNIQLGRVVEFLEPIASGNNGESRHLRVLAAWASLPTAPLRPDVIYPVYWPILVNQTEHLEMRIAALTLLIVSNPSPNRLISLYWYLQGEPNPHLYNFFYTTLKSVERTKFPCYAKMSGIAAQFARIMKKPPFNQHILTGNYMFDYQDSKRHFGAFVQGIVIANSLTNIPEVAYVTLNNHGTGLDLNHVSIYIKGEGILSAISTNLNDLSLSTRIEDILKKFKLKNLNGNPVHFELIAKIQQKAVLCLHLNQSNLIEAFKYISTLKESTYHVYETMEFHVNQQRIHVPLTMETVQVTDLGTNMRVAVIATSLFSMRGNFTHISHGRNNHFILRTSIHGTEMVENYNPLSDFWHAATRSQSVHGYLPVNVTFGFHETLFLSYNTPEEKLKAGLIAHVRTVTNIIGPTVQSRLKSVCANCTTLYTVKRLAKRETKSKTLYDFEVPELGGVFGLKSFDCEDRSPYEQSILSDIRSAHQSNCQISPILEVVLLGLHFVDYFSYIPPMGSCGLEAYLQPINPFSSEVKFDYLLRNKNHMFSLTRKNINNAEVLKQWNVAVAYDITSWLSDTLKIKATRSTPGERLLKICIEGDRETPWDWDFLSTKPSNPAEIKVHAIWGMADAAKGKCNGSSLSINLIGEIANDQIIESQQNTWPYNECQAQSQGKTFTPFTEACYEVSREMSTLRKYKVTFAYENLPLYLSKIGWKLRGLYDLAGGNSNKLAMANRIAITTTFPKDSNIAEVAVNGEQIHTEFNANLIDSILIRSRLHKYINSVFLKSFFSTCTLTPQVVISSKNISHNFEIGSEKLILARCDYNNPKFALSAINKGSFIELTFDDETDRIALSFDGQKSVVQNHTNPVPMSRNFEFSYIGSKWIRMDRRRVDLVYAEILLYVHWSPDQILLFYPNYIEEFVCGYCTLQDTNTENLYEKL